jgi:molybdate transport system permease protein
MDWEAIGLSLRLAAVTTVLLVVLGIPLAWWLTTSRWRWKFLIEAVVALPIVLPPTVLGFYLLTALGPHSPPGQFYEWLTGEGLAFTFRGLVLASILYSMPFAVQPFAAGFATVDRRIIESAWCLGVSRLATFIRVTIPLAWPGLLTGMVLSFAHTLGEFGVVLMIGGNIPGVTRTVSIAIYDDVQALNYDMAGRTAFAMLVFSFLVLAVTYGLQRKLIRAWPAR